MKKTWLITGASRDFGCIWAEADLERGDQVVATARKLADVADFTKLFGDAVLPVALDVTQPEQVQQVVQQVYAYFIRAGWRPADPNYCIFLEAGPRFLCSPRERQGLRFQRRIGDVCSIVGDRRGRDNRDDLHDLFFCEAGVEECIEFLFAEMTPLLDEGLCQCGKCGKSLVFGC
jgi:NAD(P)-dependent dehydrogenase (short-subunit alcohol dehydrogenase family)